MSMKARLDWRVREAASLWIERTATDEKVLRQVQIGTIAECALFLAEHGLVDAGAALEEMAKVSL